MKENEPMKGRSAPSKDHPFDLFEEELVRLDRSPLTRRHYLDDLWRFAAWTEEQYDEPFRVTSVTARDVAGYKNHLQSVKRLMPRTVNRKLAALSSFFRWAHGKGLIGEDPSSFIKGVKETRTAPKALERNEQNRLLRKAEEPKTKDVAKKPLRDLALVTVLLHTGIRVGELCALTIADVTIQERSGVLIVREGKGKKYREVPLNADARKALKEYLGSRPEEVREEPPPLPQPEGRGTLPFGGLADRHSIREGGWTGVIAAHASPLLWHEPREGRDRPRECGGPPRSREPEHDGDLHPALKAPP
jgi:site-specific recombinase XerD